jgi:U6 snRNA-associated Sm-like protein LSm3
LVLGDVEETIYVVEEDENEEETVKVCTFYLRQLFSDCREEA